LAERARLGGLPGASRQAVVCALELAQAPFVADDTLRLVGAWFAANPHSVAPDGRCTRLAGLYGGAEGKLWALSQDAVPVVSWLAEESATLEAMTAMPANKGGMIALFPDDPEQYVVPGGDPADELHVTLAFVAEDAASLIPADVAAIEDAAVYGAGVRTSPLLLTIVGAGTLGDSDPPATVVFLQQADGDGTDHQDGISAVASAVRAELNDYGSEGFPPEHDGFIPHMTVGYGTPIADAQALVGKQVKFSTGPTVELGDIRQPHPWDGRGTPVAVAAATSDPLQTLAREAQRARDRLRERTLAAAQVTMRDAIRRAGVKVVQKAARRSAASKAAVAAANGKWTPAVLAAAGLHEQDLVRQAFDSLGDRFESWAVDAATAQVKAVAAALGISAAAAIKRLGPRIRDLAAAARVRLNDDLTQWAYRLLEDPEPSFGDVGEQPKDPTLPMSILTAALLLADGRNVPTDGSPAGPGLVVETWATYDPNPPVETVTWLWGGSDRPFEPHVDLDGVESTWDDYEDTFAKDASEFPAGAPYWFAGDHLGCSCSVESNLIPSGDAQDVSFDGDAVAASA
jgi:2'-5' RNA ligase